MSTWRTAAAAAITTLAAVASSLAGAAPASADGSAGATSKVVGRGDVVTSILWASADRSPRRGTAPQGCSWITFSDGQVEFLIAVAAAEAARGQHRAIFDVLEAHLDSDDFATSDIQGHYCDGVTVEFRVVPRSADVAPASILSRQMITHLPLPKVVSSPPAQVPVPIGQPVFVSVPAAEWRPIETTLSAGGLVAEVRATPVGLRVFGGDPQGAVHQCEGAGRPFDPADPESPARQADRPDSCALTYRSATVRAGAGGIAGRPGAWIGTVSVLWNTEWRIAPGPWRSLGIIPRTRLIDRQVSEVATVLEPAPAR